MKPAIKHTSFCLLATALMAAGTLLTTAQAATPLNARLIARPLTPGEISTYALPAATESSGGLTAVGVGQAVYLEADVNSNIPPADITSVTWTLTKKPINSAATLQTSPLGLNVPVYEPSDRLVYQVAGVNGRMLLRPDVAGFLGTNDQYYVTATINTASEGTTNVSIVITAGTYLGIGLLPGQGGCALCHQGDAQVPDKVDPWLATEHASMFSRGIDGLISSHYSASCIPCHTVGYDTNTNAVNGGFDDVAKALNWTFPSPLTNGNWASMESNYPSLANVANIQCENCHGPGSQHFYAFGNTNFIAISYGSGVCAQCHDEPPNHAVAAEWDNSLHAVTTTDPAGNASCVGCHSGVGFIARMQGATTSDLSYHPITCQTCHDPHGETSPTNNPHLIRALTSVTLPDNTVITNGGEGLLCMECHHSRQNAAVYAATSKGSQYFGPHEGPQADMLSGDNGFTYGESIPSSAHIKAVTNSCVQCHMQTLASSDPNLTHLGGHTFAIAYNGVDMVAACQQCHGTTITNFDFPLQDYDGDGVIEGVQTEVQHLLDKLSTLLPPDNSVKSSLTINSSWTQPQLEAAYNWLFVDKDGSLGIHNTAYAVGLLKASIANLNGDANNDGLPDSWQIQYFGSINNPDAAPNAVNNTNGVPNWMMYALGLNPTQSGITVPGGVVWMDGQNLINSGATNSVHIYTAAEISFNTVSGSAYQIQGISNLSGGWQNIGNPIQGTGAPVSYLTSTRNNPQMFFRVITQ